MTTLNQAHLYMSSQAISWASKRREPETPMGTFSGASFLLGWPVSAEARGASDTWQIPKDLGEGRVQACLATTGC